MTTYTCQCGLQINVSRRKPHERSVWHRKHRMILRMLSIKVKSADIARAVGVPPSYISHYAKRVMGVAK